MDPERLETELEGLHPAAYAWARTCCGGDGDEAEEVLQTTYTKILDGRARYAGRSSLRTWLFGVVRRTAAEQRRRRRLRALRLFDWHRRRPEAASPRPDDDARRSEKQRLVSWALARLSTRQRQVLHLVFYQGLTLEQAARTMGISTGSVHVHFDRGKRRLRDLLRERGLR